MNKPIKPNITIPESFAANGVKTDFDNERLLNGFDRINPDVFAGDTLNKFIDDTYQGLNYGMAGTDAINLIKEGETLTVVNDKLVSSNIIGNIATDLNQKVDKSSMVEVPTIIEVSDPSLMPSWYRVYSDGWCEQGGYVSTPGNVTLLKPYINTDFNVMVTMKRASNPSTTEGNPSGGIINNSTIFVTGGGAGTSYWQTKGYIK